MRIEVANPLPKCIAFGFALLKNVLELAHQHRVRIVSQKHLAGRFGRLGRLGRDNSE